jgi:hypothetical protein
MAHGCGLTSVRDNRGENYEKGRLVHQKHTKKIKVWYLKTLARLFLFTYYA